MAFWDHGCLADEKSGSEKIPIGYKQDLKTGPASILCCTDGEVKEYAAEITRIDMNHEDSNKSFVIRITDKDSWKKPAGSFRECPEAGAPEWKTLWCRDSCICAGFYRRVWDFYRKYDR